MSKSNNEIKKILNEDLNRSLTHSRPKPNSNPPAPRNTSQNQNSEKKGETKKGK